MRALVFGCTGQDGSLLCASLLRQGYEVVGVSRSRFVSHPNHHRLGIAAGIHYESADLCDFQEVLQLVQRHQPDEVYNLAAQSSVGVSFQEPVRTCASIVNGTLNLLEVARFESSSASWFFAGSSEMFGDVDGAIRLDSSRVPLSPYAVAKDASFNLVRMYREAYGLRCVTGVLFNHESPLRSPTFVTQKIIHGALRCANDSSFRLGLGNLDVSRDWGWAEEYVDAMQLILRADCLNDQLICTGRLVSLAYFVETVFSRLGMDWKSKVELQPGLRRPTDIAASFGDPLPLQKALGWTATVDVDGVIDRLLHAAQTPR